MSRNSSRGSLFTKGSDKRLSTSLTIATKSQPGSDAKSSIPPSPLKAEFTSEPPFGVFKTLPVKKTARELTFNVVNEPVLESPAPSFSDHVMMYPEASSVDDDGIIDSGNKNESEDTDGLKKNGIERPDLMESFSMDTLPKMMEELHDSDEGKGNNSSP